MTTLHVPLGGFEVGREIRIRVRMLRPLWRSATGVAEAAVHRFVNDVVRRIREELAVFVRMGRPATKLLEAAQGAVLPVVGSRGRGGFQACFSDR